MKICHLKMLWEQFGNIPIDENECIEKDFYAFDCMFEKGTNKFDIWHWFDEKCPNNLHDDLMFPTLQEKYEGIN